MPFVPPMFPINIPAMELNNRDAHQSQSNLNTMDWVKYAANQQANPLMVFATTAALLAASMNSSSSQQQTTEPGAQPIMDASLLEYAKNMFLYNNFQQQLLMGESSGPRNISSRNGNGDRSHPVGGEIKVLQESRAITETSDCG